MEPEAPETALNNVIVDQCLKHLLESNGMFSQMEDAEWSAKKLKIK